MADFATFGQLKDRVREGLADFTDTFFSSTEIGVAINEGVWEIYKLLHSSNIGFFFNLTPEVIILRPSTNFYTLDNNFAWVDEIVPSVGTGINAQFDASSQNMFYYKDRHDEQFRDMLNTSTNQYFGTNGTYFYDVIVDRTLIVVPRPSQDLQVSVYTVQDPIEMENDGDIPPLKPIFRTLVVQYAVRKLKDKEETGDYMSNEKLLGFLLESTAKYIKPRGGTNQLSVETY